MKHGFIARVRSRRDLRGVGRRSRELEASGIVYARDEAPSTSRRCWGPQVGPGSGVISGSAHLPAPAPPQRGRGGPAIHGRSLTSQSISQNNSFSHVDTKMFSHPVCAIFLPVCPPCVHSSQGHRVCLKFRLNASSSHRTMRSRLAHFPQESPDAVPTSPPTLLVSLDFRLGCTTGLHHNQAMHTVRGQAKLS